MKNDDIVRTEVVGFEAVGPYGRKVPIRRLVDDLKVGDRVPMPPRKLDIRPAFDGQSKSSFKPARNGKR